ncbi:MAG: transposase [Okeania sp. SIO2H7]|nr:transposase [Okeania sp. SIO2H7]
MYRKVGPSTPGQENFELPFNGQLSPENRWITMASLIPWSEFEDEYANLFSAERGAPALPFRMALGALIIKEKLGISDRETVEKIRENPYLQYFIGLESYRNEAPFDPSLLVHFRERIGANLVNKINLEVIKKTREKAAEELEKKTPEKEVENRGKLIIDATCAPADISYPTDLNLLNRARILTEKIIDILYEPLKRKFNKKPITHRQTARKEYLKVAKKRRPA